jgi:hypothetical protein
MTKRAKDEIATPAFGGLATLGIGFCWIIGFLLPYFKFPLVIPYPFQKHLPMPATMVWL